MIPKSGNRLSGKIMPQITRLRRKARRLRGDPCHKAAGPRKRGRVGCRAAGGVLGIFAMATSGKTSTSKTGKADQRAARKARLAAALRENLKRRKRQARELARKAPPAGASAGAASSQRAEADAEAAGGAPDFRRNRHEE